MGDAGQGKPQFCRGDDDAVDAGRAFDLSTVVTGDEHVGDEIEFVPRANDTTKPRAVDHREQRMNVCLSFQTSRRFEKHSAKLRERFDDECAGHDGMSRKMIGESIVGQRNALDARCKFWRFETGNSIEKDVTHAYGPG